MAPGVQIPIVAVVRKSLRRNDALSFFVPGTRVVADGQPLALEQCTRCDFKVAQGQCPPSHVQDADAALYIVGRVLLTTDGRGQAL
jgi:hypothetical protein